jgi:Uma2 family endonuclease
VRLGIRLVKEEGINALDINLIGSSVVSMLNREQRTKFAPISPDFVVELRSKSDTLKDLQDKMQQYIDNGVRLGWLIDRKRRRVYIYRPGVAVQQLNNPETVTGLTQLSQARAQLRRALYQKTRQNA